MFVDVNNFKKRTIWSVSFNDEGGRDGWGRPSIIAFTKGRFQ